jgi:GTP-binding protein
MADIGLVGFPNAGKSSLLDRFTNARPKIAAYPFTTKIPNLGVLSIGERDIIIADSPGLIEGASRGVGLGLRFLKHITRTAALAFLIDLSDDNYLEAFDILLNELKIYSEDEQGDPINLIKKKRLLVGTKTDLDETKERLEELSIKYPAEEVFGISVFSGEGLKELSYAFLSLTDEIPSDESIEESADLSENIDFDDLTDSAGLEGEGL